MKCDNCKNKDICKYIGDYENNLRLFEENEVDEIFEVSCKKYESNAVWIVPNTVQYIPTPYPYTPCDLNRPIYNTTITCGDLAKR